VGPSLERELSISLKIKTLYTSGTILHSFGHFDYALLEVSRYEFNAAGLEERKVY
jgi:hypothetical protein